MKATERIAKECIAKIRAEISDALGNEIFVVGLVDAEGKISQVKIAARGNEDSVPVLDPHIDKGDVVLHNHPSGLISPSSADMMIAYRLGNSGVGFYIVDNGVEQVYVVAEPVLLKEAVKIDIEKLAQVLQPGGAFSQISRYYEPRDSQVKMLELVSRSMNENAICIAEAGTGVGKSLAYLLPAFEWLKHNHERTVISTGTINLQQQLLEKDIPLVNSLLKTRIKAVLVKGRSNYVCRNRLNETLQEIMTTKEENEELESISKWAVTSEDGSKSDLAFFPSPEVWGRVCSESDICLGLKCEYRESCFVLKARREAADAQVLVVNHHLLFADLEVRISGMGFEATAVLPPFQRIIFDEAHNIEASATSFFSETFSRYTINRYLHRLFSEKSSRRFGLVLSLEKLLPGKDILKDVPALITEIMESVKQLETGCLSLTGENNNYYLNDIKQLSPELCDSLVFAPLARLAGHIARFCSLFDDILEQIGDKENITVIETAMYIKRLKNIAALGSRYRDYEAEPEYVFWLEKVRGYQNNSYIRFIITPLDISEVMEKAVYEPYNAVVFTSATLSVNNTFGFWKSRLGLDRKGILEASFPSPFNYKEHVFLGIPADSPNPEQAQYQECVTRCTGRAIEISGGRALVLFTSYKMLNVTYKELKPRLEEIHIPVFKQGDDDRSRLLNNFKNDISSVLFATDSFWEGVDSPGETLELLIICKLPFKVPTDPVIRARMADIERKGGNPFMDYSLPEAVIKLKQGFGRLMRRGDDRGAVLILDARIINKMYGKFFLNSLPETIRVINKEEILMARMEDFFCTIRQAGNNQQ